MPPLVCDAAPVCVTRLYAPATETVGLVSRTDRRGRPLRASPAAVRRLGVRIQFVAGDNLGHIDPAKLRETCVDQACVAFRLSCHDLTCSWQVGPLEAGGETRLGEVRLEAASAFALARAKANVFVSVPVGGTPGTRTISLAQLGGGPAARSGLYEASYQAGDQRLPMDAPPGR